MLEPRVGAPQVPLKYKHSNIALSSSAQGQHVRLWLQKPLPGSAHSLPPSLAQEEVCKRSLLDFLLQALAPSLPHSLIIYSLTISEHLLTCQVLSFGFTKYDKFSARWGVASFRLLVDLERRVLSQRQHS